MYKPTGDSIWVSLSIITWNWSGTAEKVNNVWQLAPGTGTARSDEHGTATDVLPVWKKNAVDIPYLLEYP